MPNYNSVSLTEAAKLQNEMRHKLLLQTTFKTLKIIAGADISHNKGSNIIYAGIIILSYPDMVPLSYSLVIDETDFPYIPGYLGFREVPALLKVWQQLPQKPDVIVLDGQGITHPRKMGIASHFGLLADIPAIGCAKNMLFGQYAPLAQEKFSTSAIIHNEETIGYALRTKKDVKPVFISPGHKVSVPDSLTIMKQCIIKHRIPEPTRLAHEKVNQLRTGLLTPGFFNADVQGRLF